MKRRVAFFSLLAFFAVAAVAVAAETFHEAKPQEFDPAKTELVQAAWLSGIGCPTHATASDGSDVTDPACSTGDAKDKHNEGLLLAKTGPTSNVASAYAQLKVVKGQTVTQLGYDIRKPDSPSDPRGSHCGNGAPRFNVTTSSGTTFIGCNSPAPDTVDLGNGWLRLRWAVSIPDVQSIIVIADEGQDTGPDNFGLSVLDNIDVNGSLVGHGATDAD